MKGVSLGKAHKGGKARPFSTGKKMESEPHSFLTGKYSIQL
jgi:hypothetical protein